MKEFSISYFVMEVLCQYYLDIITGKVKYTKDELLKRLKNIENLNNFILYDYYNEEKDCIVVTIDGLTDEEVQTYKEVSGNDLNAKNDYIFLVNVMQYFSRLDEKDFSLYYYTRDAVSLSSFGFSLEEGIEDNQFLKDIENFIEER